jgi:hypothetical protein
VRLEFYGGYNHNRWYSSDDNYTYDTFGRGDAYVDSVDLEFVPEPSCFLGLLCGLGGIAAWQRRR